MSELIRTSIVLPPDALERIDKRKGKYMSRSKYILKLVDKDEAEESQLTKNGQGPKVTTPPAQAPPAVPLTSNTESAPEADNLLRHMTTEGSHVRRGGLDTNG
jgi:hypothetical protein